MLMNMMECMFSVVVVVYNHDLIKVTVVVGVVGINTNCFTDKY